MTGDTPSAATLAIVCSLRILHSLALVRLDERIRRTRGGLHIPETATRQPKWGTVFACGKGRWCPERRAGDIDRVAYEFKGQPLRVGDRVYVGAFNGKRVDEVLRLDDDHEWWIVEALAQVTSDWSQYAEADVYLVERAAP